MATSSTPFILLLVLLVSTSAASAAPSPAAASKTTQTYQNYLKKSCKTTTYPTLCLSSLSSYAATIKTNDVNLCSAALTVTLKAVTNSAALVKTLARQRGLSKTEAGVVRDCVEQLGSSVDELKQSLKALGSLKISGTDVEFQISNMKTWVSAAITDQNTCTDGLAEGKVGSAVKGKINNSVMNVVRLTSNALALINVLTY